MKSKHFVSTIRLAPSVNPAILSAYRRSGLALVPCLLLFVATVLVHSIFSSTAISTVSAPARDDREAVAAIDKKYQAAVKVNDASTMATILADDFILVTGSGKTYNKEDMLADARSGETHYERNDEEMQSVRVWGDTAVVTARLWEKYTVNGKAVDHKFWFSDTYVRAPAGWRYVFGQSSLALPNSDEPEKDAAVREKQTVSSLENKWLDALNNANVNAIAEVLATDFVRPAPDSGHFVTKEPLLAFYRSHLKRQGSNHKRIEDLTVSLYGSAALARGAVVTRNSQGQVISKLLFTDVFVRRNEKWQAVSAQENPITNLVTVGAMGDKK